MSVEELYDQLIKQLPAAERLRLATVILSNISPRAVVDYSEEWTEGDYHDFSKASWDLINGSLEKDEHA